MVQKCKFPGKSATIRNVLGLSSQIVTILGILSAKIYDWLIRYWFKHLHHVFSAHGSICTSATEESQNQVYPCSYLLKTISAQSVQNDAQPPRGSFLFHCFFWPPKKKLQTKNRTLNLFSSTSVFVASSSIRKATLISCSQWQVSSGCIFHELRSKLPSKGWMMKTPGLNPRIESPWFVCWKGTSTFVSQITRFSTRNLPKQKRAMPCPTQKALDVAPQVAKRAAEIGRLNINHAVSSRKKMLGEKNMIKKTLARRGVSF